MNHKALGIVVLVGLVGAMALVGSAVSRTHSRTVAAKEAEQRAKEAEQREYDQVTAIRAPLNALLGEMHESLQRVNNLLDGSAYSAVDALKQADDARFVPCRAAISRIVAVKMDVQRFVHEHPKSAEAPELLDSLAVIQSWCLTDAERETDILLTTLYLGTEQAAKAKERLSR